MNKHNGTITGFRARQPAPVRPRRRDELTPIYFAVCATVFFELVALLLLHSDPDMHLANYIGFGIVTFAFVGIATEINVNG